MLDAVRGGCPNASASGAVKELTTDAARKRRRLNIAPRKIIGSEQRTVRAALSKQARASALGDRSGIEQRKLVMQSPAIRAGLFAAARDIEDQTKNCLADLLNRSLA